MIYESLYNNKNRIITARKNFPVKKNKKTKKQKKE
jgi:hypothetical protein